MKSNNELSLVPINELLSENFYIPAYQRGYRWNQRQVEDLLNDIREFQQESESRPKECFYCLQPLVVKKNGDEWELVDGQQRLTTIYLILKFLEKLVGMLEKKCYGMRYETRPGSADFLENIDFEKRDENIDYHHICNAYETIERWFELHDGTYRIKFLQTLLNDEESGKNVKVIWYDIKELSEPVEVFTRLNMGKIPLANSELVKALFLREKNFDKGKTETPLQQIKIAQEWDTIEKSLQEDDFWYFIHNENLYPNRIEFILELMAEEIDESHTPRHDQYYVFLVFNALFKSDESVSKVQWDDIKKYFMTLEEWYRDRYLYHLVGYLINQNQSVIDIMRVGKLASNKQDFRNRLKSMVFEALFGGDRKLEELLENNAEELAALLNDKLSEWSYSSNRERIKPILLLFNIATLVRNTSSTMRFQFDNYKKGIWDIEHIRSVKSEIPKRVDEQKAWIENVLFYITGTNYKSKQAEEVSKLSSKREKVFCHKMLAILDLNPFNSELFDRIYFALLTHFKEGKDRDTDDSIGNLALLDAGTNRSYKNAVFPLKRRSILALDKEGTFVPLCTKNVFLKYYSEKIDHMMFWGESDRDAYSTAIVEMLVWFFTHESKVKT